MPGDPTAATLFLTDLTYDSCATDWADTQTAAIYQKLSVPDFAKQKKYSNYNAVQWQKISANDWISAATTIATQYYTINAGGTTWDPYYGCDYDDATFYKQEFYKQKSPQDRMREILSKQSMPIIVLSTRKLNAATDIREIRARQTLRKIVGEVSYRRFLKDGFVSIMNPTSRKVYCLYPGAGMDALTKVYDKGKLLDRLCIHLDGDFPPTDHMIVRCLLVLNNENRLWELANKHGVGFIRPPADLTSSNKPTLAQRFRELKGSKLQNMAQLEQTAFTNQNYHLLQSVAA